MEKLNKDLFKNPKVENPHKAVAGARRCLSQWGGNSYCPTGGGGIDLVDVGGG